MNSPLVAAILFGISSAIYMFIPILAWQKYLLSVLYSLAGAAYLAQWKPILVTANGGVLFYAIIVGWPLFWFGIAMLVDKCRTMAMVKKLDSEEGNI